MRVSFDLDGVLHGWHEAVWLKYFFGKLPGYEDYRSFWKEGWRQISEKEWGKIVSDLVMYTVPARADIVRMMQDISITKFVMYISTRPRDAMAVSQQWLVKNGFPAPQALYITNDKVLTCQKMDVDLHVDDRIDTMNDLADNGIRVLGVKQPWNEDGIGNFPHVDNILKLEREIARIDTARRVHRRRNGNS